MSGLLLIILYPKTPIKMTKNTQMDPILLQISLDCVLCVSGTKDWKRSENEANMDKTELDLEKSRKPKPEKTIFIWI